MTEPTRPGRGVEWKGEIPPTQREQDVLDDFHSGKPLSTLQKPQELIDVVNARKVMLSKTMAVLKEPDKKNISSMERLGNGFNRVTRFAWNHPWLTAGIVIALLLFLATSYLTVSALMGHTSIAILGAHPELGASIAAMTLYYGVYLVNMARRAALKDDLEKGIEAQNALRKKIVDEPDTNISTLVADMNKEISKINDHFAKIKDDTTHAHGVLKNQYDKANRSLKKIQAYQKQLGDQLPEEAKSLLRQTELVCPILPETALQIKSLDVDTDVIEFPDFVTDAMEKRIRKGRSLGKKFTDFFKETGSFMTKNPGSTTLIFGGVAICLLGGVGAFFWLHGYSGIYFYGSLSAMTILPILIYGGSLVYEGYNSGTINDLRKKLLKMEENKNEIEEAIEREKNRLDEISHQARGTLRELSLKLEELHQFESEHVKARKLLEDYNIEQWHKIEGKCESLIDTYTNLFPNLNIVEARRVLMDLALGASRSLKT